MDTTENKLLNETQIRVLFKCLFEDSPISIWEEDFSAVYKYLTSLREQGIRLDFVRSAEALALQVGTQSLTW